MPTYIRLTDYKSSDEKEQEFFNPENRYEAKQEEFSKIPANPIAYWVTNGIKEAFNDGNTIEDIAPVRQGFQTGDNDKFLRYWFEIQNNRIGFNMKSTEEFHLKKYLYAPYNKGGEFRKWFGNNDYLVKFNKSNYNFLLKMGNNLPSRHLYFQSSLTWSALSSGNFGARWNGIGFTFSAKGACSFPLNNDTAIFVLTLLNSKIAAKVLEFFSPTLDFNVGDIRQIPLAVKWNKFINEIKNLTQQNIDISKEEWDSRETSWDFTKNELIKHKTDTKIETAYSNYCNYWQEQLNTLHKNEEELNRLFIDIYELQDELTPDVELKDITILKNETKIVDKVNGEAREGDLGRDELVFQADEIMKQFISYGVGVMFGRYSLDSDGLLIANMGQEVPTSTTFEIDDDNVIPVLEDDYFKDDIASRFVQFVKATFGEEDLSENIRFIESSLGTTLRKYFVKGFYEDHIKRYKKRPIYWMIASPKKGFMSLIYMHRYTSDVFATIQNGYLREYMTKLEANGENLQREADDSSNSSTMRSRADKEVLKINKTLDEIIKFDREVLTSYAQNGIDIDLDDGVKVNYCKFQDILFPITGLCK
jgi:hypothetical protein